MCVSTCYFRHPTEHLLPNGAFLISLVVSFVTISFLLTFDPRTPVFHVLIWLLSVLFFFLFLLLLFFVSFFPIHFCFSSQSYPVTLFPLLFIVSCSHAFLLPGYLFILSLFHLFSHYHEHNTWVNTESTTLDASLPAPKMSLVW